MSLDELDRQFQERIHWYNTCHVNRDTGVTPASRLKPSVTKEVPQGLNLDDILCFRQERKVAKDNSFSPDGGNYTIPGKHNMVALKARVNIQLGKKIKVWHNQQFLCELTYVHKQRSKPLLFVDGPRTGGIILASRQGLMIRIAQ